MNLKQKTVRAVIVIFLFMAFASYIYLMQGVYEKVSKNGMSFKSAMLFAAILFASSMTWDVCKHLMVSLPQKRFDNFVNYLVLAGLYGVSYFMYGIVVYDNTNQLTSAPSMWAIPAGIASLGCAITCTWAFIEAVNEASSS